MKEIERFNNLHSAVLEAQRLHNQSFPAALQAIEELQRIQEKILPAQIAQRMIEAQKLFQQTIPAGMLRMAQELQKLQEQTIPNGMLRMVQELQKLQEQTIPAGMLRMVQELQKLKEQTIPNGMLRMAEEFQRIQYRFNASGLPQAIDDLQRLNNNQLQGVLDRIAQIAKSGSVEDININPDGSITSKESTFTISEVENALETSLSGNSYTEGISAEIALDNFLVGISRQHPIIAKLLVHIIIPVIISILIAELWSRPQQFDKTNCIRNIKKEVQTVVAADSIMNNFRFVSAHTLQVRKSNSVNSSIIGQLHFGQLVRIIQKKKSWTLVELQNSSTDIVLKGWVFTRYIKRFD
jgi:hypothetical protein